MVLKTRKSALKRVKLKKRSLIRKSSFKRHLLRKKDNNNLRRLSKRKQIHKVDQLSFRKMLNLSLLT